MSRRRFVLVGGVVAVAVVGGGALWWRRLGSGKEDRLLARLFKEHFSYLSIDDDGLLEFLAEYQAAKGSLLLGESTARQPLPFLDFLQSTDFFANGADESRVVRYVMLHDPYINPCFNPFRTG